MELSGGADSANVALAVAATRDDFVRSYGLVVDGEVGRHQRRRRTALAQRLGLLDVEIPAGEHPPFAPNGIRGRKLPHNPAATYYREAFDAVRDAAVEHKTRVIFTGLGGDEINALHPHEQSGSRPAPVPEPVPWLGPVARAAAHDVDINLAPVSAVPLPTLMAFSLHNPAYLQAGVWPVAPLAHPAIGRFAEQLPREWRQGKTMFRQRLQRAGFSDEITHPRLPENFSGLMQTGLRRFGLPLLKEMLRESILIPRSSCTCQRLRGREHRGDCALDTCDAPDRSQGSTGARTGARSGPMGGRRTMFAQPNGRPIDPRRDMAEWKALLTEAGVRDARLHDARHTAATVLLLLQVPERAVMEFMGWSNSGITKRYQQVTAVLRGNIAKRLDEFLCNEG